MYTPLVRFETLISFEFRLLIVLLDTNLPDKLYKLRLPVIFLPILSVNSEELTGFG